MFKIKLLRALVTERLAAAAEEISTAVEGMITEERTLNTTERSSELQRAVIRKQLEVVADEIFRTVQTMMGDIKADVLGSHDEIERHLEPLDIPLKTKTKLLRTERAPGSDCEKDVTSKLLKCEWSKSSSEVEEQSHLPLINEVSMETNSELIHTKASHFCETQRAEKSALTMMETETKGKERVLPGSHQDVLSSKNHQADSEVNDDSEAKHNGKTLKSNKRKGFQRHSHGADGCKMCDTSLRKRKKIKKNTLKFTPTNRIQTTGQIFCRVCGKVFRYKRSFLKHVLQHEQFSELCGACGKHLESGECLTVHLQSHNEENICRDDRELEADCCNARSQVDDSDGADSGDREKEDIHLQKSSKVKNQESNKPKGPNGKDVPHLKYHCKVCCRSFCYRALFLKHVQEDERDTDICGVCGERFESEDSLRFHLQTYIRTTDCEVCGKHFDAHKQLEMHMRIHTGEKPYVCAVCGKAFSQNGNLMGHMRVHTGERPYVCRVCRQAFSFKEYMMAHMRIHTGEKPFLCSVCGKGFRQRGTLKTHVMIHTGESTHQCSICNKKFYKSGALKIHMRSHTGEKPYLCSVCGKSFMASGSLSKHLGIHEGR